MSKTLKHLRPEQRLSACRAAAARKMPYFSAGLQALAPREAPGTNTVALTEGGILMVDSAALADMTADEGGAVVTAMYLHQFLRHAERFRTQVGRGVLTEDDRTLWNYAASAEIADDLEAAGFTLPHLEGVPPITPKSLELEDNQTAEQYVAILKERGGNGPGPGDDSEGKGWSRTGSAAGNPAPGEPEKTDEDARTPTEQNMVRRACAEQAVAAANRSAGNVPAGLLLAAEGEIPDSTISWEDKLQHSLCNASNFVAGHGDYTWTTRHHHQGALDYMMGEDAGQLPGEHRPVANVAVVIDTSGSMLDDLPRAVGEARGILDAMGDVSVTFMSIDCEVQGVQQVDTIEEVLANLKGGGGTSFVPAFDDLAEYDPRPDVIVFITDGYGDAPMAPPEGIQVIWVIVPGGSRPCTSSWDNKINWGEFIFCDSADEERV